MNNANYTDTGRSNNLEIRLSLKTVSIRLLLISIFSTLYYYRTARNKRTDLKTIFM